MDDLPENDHLIMSKPWELIPEMLDIRLNSWELSTHQNNKYEKTRCVHSKILTGLGALDSKMAKAQFLMILSKASCFIVEIGKHMIFANVRGALSLKVR